MVVPNQPTLSPEEVICHMHNLKLHETYGFTYRELIVMDVDKYYELIKCIVDLKTIGFKTTVRLDGGLRDFMETVHQPQTTGVTDAIHDLSFFTKPASGCEEHQTIGRLHTNADEKDLKDLVGKDEDVVTVTSLKSGIRAPVGSFYKFLHAPQAPLFMSQSMLPSDTTNSTTPWIS